jgi:hypothetical protein
MLALASYAEVSVSGTGHHVILKASLNGGGRHPEGIGVFQESRLWYCTGEHVTGTPETIEERQAELEAVLAEYLPKRPTIQTAKPAQPVDVDDQELLERMFSSKSEEKIRRLWEGDRPSTEATTRRPIRRSATTSPSGPTETPPPSTVSSVRAGSCATSGLSARTTETRRSRRRFRLQQRVSGHPPGTSPPA